MAVNWKDEPLSIHGFCLNISDSIGTLFYDFGTFHGYLFL